MIKAESSMNDCSYNVLSLDDMLNVGILQLLNE